MKTFAGMGSGKGMVWNVTAIVLMILPVLAGCTGPMIMDVTPPAANQPTQQAAAPENGPVDISPLLPPDPAAGKKIYTRDCAACHGDTGMGDGPRSPNLPSVPPPVGSSAYSRFVPPSRWFQVITRGRIDKLMPSYSTTLSDRQRWDTVAYMMTLGTTPEQVTDGFTIYRDNCQECHPENTAGYNGSPAQQIPELFHKSVEDLTSGMSYNSLSMNHAGIDLTEAEKDDVALYLRTLVFAHSAGGFENTPAPSVKSGSGTETIVISGKVVNGSGGTIPAGVTATLTGFNDGVSQFALVSPLYAGDRFSFDNVPGSAGQTFTVSIRYKDALFTSPVIHAENADETQNSRVTIYEPDTDISKITAERVHIFFEFPRSDTLRVVQLYVLSNPSNRLITSESAGGVVIEYPLPAGASNMQFQTGSLGQRFLFTRDGVGDTQGIPPGDGTQVLFSYDLPYRGEAGFSITVPVAAQTVNVMLAAEGVNLKSPQLQDIGRKDIQNSTWQLFTAQGVKAGEGIMLKLSGKPRVTTPQENEMSNSLAAGIVSLVIVLVLILTIIFRDIMDKRTRTQEISQQRTEPVDHNAVLDAIIALDDQFQAGQIPAAAYRERRTELKSRLRRLP